jgi:hypothetical protein
LALDAGRIRPPGGRGRRLRRVDEAALRRRVTVTTRQIREDLVRTTLEDDIIGS